MISWIQSHKLATVIIGLSVGALLVYRSHLALATKDNTSTKPKSSRNPDDMSQQNQDMMRAAAFKMMMFRQGMQEMMKGDKGEFMTSTSGMMRVTIPMEDESAKCVTKCVMGMCRDSVGAIRPCRSDNDIIGNKALPTGGLPFPNPKNFDEQEKNLEASGGKMKQDTPNIFQNVISAIGTGLSRLAMGENVFTGEPAFTGLRPQEIVP